MRLQNDVYICIVITETTHVAECGNKICEGVPSTQCCRYDTAEKTPFVFDN